MEGAPGAAPSGVGAATQDETSDGEVKRCAQVCRRRYVIEMTKGGLIGGDFGEEVKDQAKLSLVDLTCFKPTGSILPLVRRLSIAMQKPPPAAIESLHLLDLIHHRRPSARDGSVRTSTEPTGGPTSLKHRGRRWTSLLPMNR